VTAKPNAYCDGLGIAVPSVDLLAARPGVKLFHLMIAVLLEHGGALDIEAIAERVERAGGTSRVGDLAYSLVKAWHGLRPVYRDRQGRFGLDLCARGVLHGCVRLRWGFLDEALPVEWAQPGEPHLHEVLRGAQETGQALDVVVGAAPGWSEPWARARRVEIVSLDAWHVTLRAAGTTYPVDQRDIQAVRPAAAPAAAGPR
jgi:hypothetical protein